MTTATIPFQASRLKIWRANLLFEGLEFKIRNYMARNPAHANIRPALPPKDSGMVYHEIVIVEPIPITFSASIGDVIHNLRTALDLLVCDLVRDNNGNPEEVYFPFAKNSTDLDVIIAKRKIDQAKPEAVNLLRNFKPYLENGNEALRGIHDLDIIDKHRELLLTHGRIVIPHSNGNPIIPSSGVQFSSQSGVGIISRGHTRASNWPIGERLPVTFDITFPQGVPFAAQPLIKTCVDLIREFTDLIDRFESLCFDTVTKKFPWE